jgi:hypothetical protein
MRFFREANLSKWIIYMLEKPPCDGIYLTKQKVTSVPTPLCFTSGEENDVWECTRAGVRIRPERIAVWLREE